MSEEQAEDEEPYTGVYRPNRIPRGGGRSNAQRAAAAETALRAYMGEESKDSLEEALLDLLTDLRHWADAQVARDPIEFPYERGDVLFSQVRAASLRHYLEER